MQIRKYSPHFSYTFCDNSYNLRPVSITSVEWSIFWFFYINFITSFRSQAKQKNEETKVLHFTLVVETAFNRFFLAQTINAALLHLTFKVKTTLVNIKSLNKQSSFLQFTVNIFGVNKDYLAEKAFGNAFQ